MFKESFMVTVKKPKEQVFEALTDFDTFAKASKGRVTFERVSGKPLKGVGETIRIRSDQPAMPGLPEMQEVLCETTAWDPPRRCVRRFDIKDLPTVVGFTLEDCPGGTRVAVDLQVEPKSVLYKMLMPMLGKKIASEKDKAIAMIQERLDTTA